MKKIISMLASLAIIAGTLPMMVAFADADSTAWDGTIATEYAGGTGTSDDPYQIATPAQLARVAQEINAGSETRMNYILTADIDLNNQEWTPIGPKQGTTNGDKCLNGTFNGNGHVIKNLSISKVEADNCNYGFFGYVHNGAKIINLGFDGVRIKLEARGTIGAVAGMMYGGELTNCYVKNALLYSPGYGSVGGMVGRYRNEATATKFTNCYVKDAELCTTDSRCLSAGFCPAGTMAEFTNCYTSNIKRGSDGGVLYAFANTTGNVTATNCYTDSQSLDCTGTGDTAVHYDAAKDLCPTVSTKNQIKDAFSSILGYAISGDVNEGYPCLAFETGWNGEIATSYAGGQGTVDAPYEIANAAQLAYLAQQTNSGVTTQGKYFVLTADIDLGSREWTPIGYFNDWSDNKPFAGTFDGNGHKVTNLKISGDLGNGRQIGLFGRTQQGTIKNLGLERVNISISGFGQQVNGKYVGQPIGALVGYMFGGTIDNCYVANAEVGNTFPGTSGNVGGMVGGFHNTSQETTISNCYVKDVALSSGHNYSTLGGLVGGGAAQTFTNCYTSNITRGTSSNIATLYPICQYSGSDATNCYTDSEALDNNRDSGAKYDAKYDLGTKTDKAGIIAALVTNLAGTSFKVDSSKNDGYPTLSWEKKAYEVTAITPGTDVKVSIAMNKYTVGSVLYVATYDADNRMIDVVVLDPEDGENATGLSSEGAAYVKAFVWNSDYAPLAVAKTVAVQ